MPPFNSVAYCDYLGKLRNYVASAAFISNIGWRNKGYSQVQCHKETCEDMICIMMGKVSSYKLNTGPIRNYNKQFNVPFFKAKHQFTLSTPNEPALIHDFQASISALAKAQEAIENSEDCVHMIVQEGAEQAVRFSSNIFTKRVRGICCLSIIFINTCPRIRKSY